MVKILSYIQSVFFTGLCIVNVHAAESVGASHPHASVDDLRSLSKVSELNCIACHQPAKADSQLSRKQAPILDEVGQRVNPTYLLNFLTDPQKTKPGTTMPHVLAALPADERAAAAEALTHYLVSRSGKVFVQQPIESSLTKEGHDHFHSLGCVACHHPRDEHAKEQPLKEGKPLGDLSGKYSASSLTQFLQDPLSVRPAGRMPALNLTRLEARALSHFLLQGQHAAKAFSVDASLVKKGAKLYQSLDCARCHEGTAPEKSYTAFADLRNGKGCLSGKEGSWPLYTLSPEETASVLHAQKMADVSLSDENHIQLTMVQHNCVACHERGDLGGVSKQRNEYFKTLDQNLGEQGRIPPDLTLVGARLTESYLKKTLLAGEKVRPYMTTRMPRFGEDNVGHLIPLFKQLDKLPAVPEPENLSKQDKRDMRRNGEQLMGMNFACYTCHTFKGKAGGAIKGLDLYTTINRLERDYFHSFMMNPQAHKPNVIMPSFFPGGESPIKDIYGGDAVKQIESMWTFLSGDFYYLPKGLVAPKALLAGSKDEAVILRRTFAGLHRRGISVAYPSGLNLAFNPQELDVFSMWQGEFLDASPAFNRQGEGGVQPNGENQVVFPKGPAVFFWKEGEPWPESDIKHLGYQFKGYSLGDKRRPTFMYDYKTLSIKDIFEDKKSGENLWFERRLEITAPEKIAGLYLRVPSATVKSKGGKTVTVSVQGAGELIDADKDSQRSYDLYAIDAFKGRTIITLTYTWRDK